MEHPTHIAAKAIMDSPKSWGELKVPSGSHGVEAPGY